MDSYKLLLINKITLSYFTFFGLSLSLLYRPSQSSLFPFNNSPHLLFLSIFSSFKFNYSRQTTSVISATSPARGIPTETDTDPMLWVLSLSSWGCADPQEFRNWTEPFQILERHEAFRANIPEMIQFINSSVFNDELRIEAKSASSTWLKIFSLSNRKRSDMSETRAGMMSDKAENGSWWVVGNEDWWGLETRLVVFANRLDNMLKLTNWLK